MAMTLSGTSVKATVSTTATNIETAETQTAKLSLSKTGTITFAAGDAAGQAETVWARTESIAAGGNWDIDLNAGEVNAFGDTIAFDIVRAVLVINPAATGDPEIYVGGAGANEFDSWLGDPSDTVIVHAGGMFLLATPGNTTTNGYVTGAGQNILRIHNSDGAVAAVVQVVVLGCIA